MNQPINEIIAAERAKLGLTQAQLAECVGIKREALSRIERGLHSPSIDTIGKIAAALGLELTLKNTAQTRYKINP